MKIAALLVNAQNAIQTEQQCSKQEASLEARLLLQHLLNVNRAWLISHDTDAVESHTQISYETLVERRVNGEPIAYILGEREFYGLQLKVTPDTLIPRPDTETLVEAALAKTPSLSLPRRRESSHASTSKQKPLDSRLRGNDLLRVLDLGTGTGAIALAIAKHCPHAEVTAVDASESALKVAQENAQNLNIPNVQFVHSNWFDALEKQTFDVIVSNPPYIEETDSHLSQGDLRFEPVSALASGKDGLNDSRKIIQQAPAHLKPNGWLMLEHGHNQAAAVATLLKESGFVDINHALDLAGIQRVTLGSIT
ncbi:MAG: peptide chain release factor N(5)-glutamine methyltransferase [Methylophilaceae bacterium]